MTAFLFRFLANPLRVGAIAPSSPYLARAMAGAADLSGNVLELGPGTGVFTAALLARGLPPERLTLIEYDADFAAALRVRFAGTRVIEGDAFAFPELVGDNRFSTIISGLPLLNYPRDQGRALIAAALSHGASFVQFSYGWSAPVPEPEGASVTLVTRVWRNLPPAAVWVYRGILRPRYGSGSVLI
jgi:phosphatidylethanolamine/phosphatidyl-N-methylethanolamine N-methyltransferase